jgi:hypothetical protein
MGPVLRSMWWPSPGVPGASISANNGEYRVPIRLTVGEIPRISMKLLSVSCISVYNVDNPSL